MTEKKRFIEINTLLQDEIAAIFEVTTRTVRSALTFETNSPSAKIIRSYALNHGGKLFEIVPVDNPYEKNSPMEQVDNHNKRKTV